MKSKMLKISVAIGLMSASALALAATGCCGDLACCVQQMFNCCL